MSQEPFDPSKLDIDFTSDTVPVPQPTPSPNLTPKETPSPVSQKPVQPVNMQKTDEWEENFFTDDTIDIETLSTILTDDEFRPEEVKQEIVQAVESNGNIPQKIIFDINIKTVADIADILLRNSYDFVACSPEVSFVKLSYKKDGILKETRSIEYGVYMQLLIEAKTLTAMDVRIVNQEQHGKGNIVLRNKNIEITGKVTPSDTGSGEVLFLKAALSTEKKKIPKKKQSSSFSAGTAFGFIGVTLLLGLIIWGAFLAFVVMNAKTVEDVRFFTSIGVNINSINDFIKTAVTVIFSILLVVELSILAVFWFKALYTKKEFKAKKIGFSIVSGLVLILAFSSGGFWMYVDKKVQALPRWGDMSRWEIQFWNNDLLVHADERIKNQAFYTDLNNIVGPVNMKIDVSTLADMERRNGFIVEDYQWRINGTPQTTKNPEIFYLFDVLGTHKVSLTLKGRERGVEVEKPVENIPDISIAYLVHMTTEIQPNGGKMFSFDAENMKNIWDIEWSIWNEDKWDFIPQEKTFHYNPQTIYRDNKEDIVAFRGINDEENVFRKFFVLRGEDSTISGNIVYEVSPDNDLEYTFSLDDVESITGGAVEKYEWTIEWRDIVKTVGSKDNIADTKKNSTVKHTFKEYGTYDIQVTLTNKSGRFVVISDTVSTVKKVKLENQIKIFVEWTEVKQRIQYFPNLGEYRVGGEIPAPTEVVFDASEIQSANILYRIEDIEWDKGNNGVIDETGKKFITFFPASGSEEIGIKYTLRHLRDENDVREMQEVIHLDFGKKEALLFLDIKPSSEYAPADVRFDASASRVEWENIVKFIYDYGDGTPTDARDAVNPGHRYLTSWNYIVKLTVVTASGKEYSTQKSLILKDMEEIAKIKASRKRVKVGESINFDSTQSEGLIMQYTWDFGDEFMSSVANPSHEYQKPGTYTVQLRIDFANNNHKMDTIQIEVE